MNCPSCRQSPYNPLEVCAHCGFKAEPAQVEDLERLNWMLAELANWPLRNETERVTIRQHYLTRQRELEVQLGLRQPPFSEAEAGPAWSELFQRETLRQELTYWAQTRLVRLSAASKLADQVNAQVKELQERLEGHPRPADPPTAADYLNMVNFLLEAIDYLKQHNGFATPEAHAQLQAQMLARKHDLEIKRAAAAPAPPEEGGRPEAEAGEATGATATEAPAAEVAVAEAPVPVTLAVPPSPPTVSLPLRDRLWRVLLSERTLQAMLFLGIFLLFAAALSFVAWGWKNFPAVLRVAIPTGFTILFFALGWYVRNKTQLYRSGIALSAIAALLIPIDFYTIYANFDIRPDYGPAFWLATSLVCLAAYIITTLLIRNPLFGYLVGVAAGSSVLALIEVGHQAFDLSLDWRTAGLSALAVCFSLLGDYGRKGLAGDRPARSDKLDVEGPESPVLLTRLWAGADVWPLFAAPLRSLALLAAGALMLLTLGWRVIGRTSFDTLHYAMTFNWWAGGFILGWGAVRYRSRSLGLLAALALPVATTMTQAAIFDQTDVNPAWHAFGLAWLTPMYFRVGRALLARREDPVLYGHGRTATGWGVALLIIAALWSLTDLSSGAAAASSHIVLAVAVVLAARWWQQPRYLYGASLLAFSAVTFAMTEAGLSLPQVSLGWVSLSLLHIISAAWLSGRPRPHQVASDTPPPAMEAPKAGESLVADKSVATDQSPEAAHLVAEPPTTAMPCFVGPLAAAGYIIAALALPPTYFPYDGQLLWYALSNWLGLTVWGACLSHLGRAGFAARPAASLPRWRRAMARARFHWLAALPLPAWLWVLFANRGPLNTSFPLALAALAWGMTALSYRLTQVDVAYGRGWRLVGLTASLAAPALAFTINSHDLAVPICLLAAGWLYLADAITMRQSWRLTPGGLMTAWGLGWLLSRLNVSFDGISLALTLLAAAYFMAGLWVERQRSPVLTHRFLDPLYLAAHGVGLVVLARIYSQPLNDLFYKVAWSDSSRLWGALDQAILGLVYAAYAWGAYQERWGYVATWLLAASGGFIAIAYSRGRGSSAAKVAVGVYAFILAERGLHWLRQRSLAWGRQRGLQRRYQAALRLAWRLYRRPLLVTGWMASAGVIGLALVRNLLLLGGGRTQQIWAVAGLALICGLYALSARLFRRTHFVWLAAGLSFAPWTILTNLGWFVLPAPSLAGFALGWAALAWALYLLGLALGRVAAPAYTSPLKWLPYLLQPFLLLWGVADVVTSRTTFAQAIAFYGLAAGLDYCRLMAWTSASQPGRTPDEWAILGKTEFLYPALGLTPVWCVYLLRWVLPAARHEHYGLMLLLFGPLGLMVGQTFKRAVARSGGKGDAVISAVARACARPAYLTGYLALIVGILLTAHYAPLLALTLLYGAVLCLVSARLFRHPLWVYPAAIAAPLALLIALNQAGVPGNRHGWYLIGLAAVYLALAWSLRRARAPAYGTAALTMGFALIALGLPPSSQDKTGALWGYAGAALLYALTAAWLRQALLLTPACALAIVPYALALQRSQLLPCYYGLALFPPALAALAAGWRLDHSLDDWRDFPWGQASRWPAALAERLLNWWALPLYSLGFGLAAAAPFFSDLHSDLSAFSFGLLMLVCGWAIYRFRLRVWLLAAGLAGHLATLYMLDAWGWWDYPEHAWLRFTLVTVLTTLLAVAIEWRRGEGSPLHVGRWLRGWSRPLYGLALLDILAAQTLSLSQTEAGAGVTLIHAILTAGLASFWQSAWLPYISAIWGVAALLQWLSTLEGPIEGLPVALAQLMLAYGLVGFGLALARSHARSAAWLEEPGQAWLAIWQKPLQRFSLWFSLIVLGITAGLGLDLAKWTARALLGFPFRQIVELATVQMGVGVLALLGLLYVGAAFIYRRLRAGYAAVAMLLGAWMLHAFYVQQWDGAARVQWYALPAGLYLLGVAYLEWQRGNKTLARWLDYAGVVLMMGSLFWQTMLFGWRYALLLGSEGFAAFGWGSARRLRRFLYAGMLGVVLATLAQLINALQSINQWIVFGMIGLLVILMAVLIERKLEEVKAQYP